MAASDPVMTADEAVPKCKVCAGSAHICELPDSTCRFATMVREALGHQPAGVAALLRATEDRAVERLSEARTRAIDRLVTIVDEACGLQPRQSTDETLTVLEQHLFEQRMRLALLEQVAEAAREVVDMFDRLDLVREAKSLNAREAGHVTVTSRVERQLRDALRALDAAEKEAGG